MNRFGKLVMMELHRFWKIYAALMLVTFLSQSGGLFLYLRDYKSGVNRYMAANSLPTYADYAEKVGRTNFHMAVNQAEPWFTGPVFLCIAALLFYVFFIWYRDWIGKNSFAYRLLMLPTPRMNLYASKLTAIMLLVFGLIAWQLATLPIHLELFRQTVPRELAILETAKSFISHHSVFRILIPPTFLEFVLYYGAGLVVVSVLFTAVLLERSYRSKGLAGGIAYAVLAGWAMIAPMTFNDGKGIELYPLEIFWLQFSIGLVLLGLSLGLAWLLITRKITV